MIKMPGELAHAHAFGFGTMHCHPGSPLFVAHVCLIDDERRLQAGPSKHGKQEKIEQVSNEKNLKRMDIWLAAAPHVFSTQKSRPGKEHPQGAEDLGIP